MATPPPRNVASTSDRPRRPSRSRPTGLGRTRAASARFAPIGRRDRGPRSRGTGLGAGPCALLGLASRFVSAWQPPPPLPRAARTSPRARRCAAGFFARVAIVRHALRVGDRRPRPGDVLVIGLNAVVMSSWGRSTGTAPRDGSRILGAPCGGPERTRIVADRSSARRADRLSPSRFRDEHRAVSAPPWQAARRALDRREAHGFWPRMRRARCRARPGFVPHLARPHPAHDRGKHGHVPEPAHRSAADARSDWCARASASRSCSSSWRSWTPATRTRRVGMLPARLCLGSGRGDPCCVAADARDLPIPRRPAAGLLQGTGRAGRSNTVYRSTRLRCQNHHRLRRASPPSLRESPQASARKPAFAENHHSFGAQARLRCENHHSFGAQARLRCENHSFGAQARLCCQNHHSFGAQARLRCQNHDSFGAQARLCCQNHHSFGAQARLRCQNHDSSARRPAFAARITTASARKPAYAARITTASARRPAFAARITTGFGAQARLRCENHHSFGAQARLCCQNHHSFGAQARLRCQNHDSFGAQARLCGAHASVAGSLKLLAFRALGP